MLVFSETDFGRYNQKNNIKMKRFFLNLLILVSLNIYSQNNLSSLFNIKYLPKDMAKVKSFIENSTSPYLISDLIFGGTNQANSNFQFKINSKENLLFELPTSNGLSLSFFDYKTKLPTKSHTFYIDYQFLYLNYYNEFILNNETFSDAKCFDLAYQLNTDSNNDQNPILDFYFNLFKGISETETFSVMLDEIKKNYKIKSPKKINEIFNDDENNLTLDDKADLFTEYLYNEIDVELSIILFKTFIKNSNNAKTWENIEKVYGKDIKVKLDEIFVQNIIIKTNQQAKLNIPDKFILFNDENIFTVTNIECKLDLRNSKLTMNFKSVEPVEMIIKNAIKLSGNKPIKSEKIKSKEVLLLISETGNELIVKNYFTNENYKVEDFK